MPAELWQRGIGPSLRRIGLAAKLAEALPSGLPSPNATPPHHIVLALLTEVPALLGDQIRIALVRADSGFFEEARRQYRAPMAKGKLHCGVTCPLDRIGQCTGGCW